MTTKLTTAFDPDIICSLAATAYETEIFTDTLEKITRQFDDIKLKTEETLKFWSKLQFDSLNPDNLAILNLDRDSITIITQIRRHHTDGKAKLWFGLYSNSHDNHSSLAKFSDKTGPTKDMITTYKECPNVDYLVTCVDNVEDINSSVKIIEGKGLRRAFIPIPLLLIHTCNTKASGPYGCSLLFFIFTEVWEQVKAAKVTHSPYVKALLEFCITPIYHKENAKKQCLEGFKFSVISSKARTYKSTLQAISTVVETQDKKLCQEEDEAKQLLVITQSQNEAKESTATADSILDTIITDNASSSGLEDVLESEDNNKVMETRKRKLQHQDDPTFKIPRKTISEVNTNKFEVSKESKSDSHYGSDEDTTIQQSNYQARTAQRHDAQSSHLPVMEGTNSANMAHAGAAITKHAIAEGIKAQKSLLDKISDINLEVKARLHKICHQLSAMHSGTLPSTTSCQ